MLSRILILLFLNSLFISVNAEEIQTRVGYAYDNQSSELLYTENHFEEFNNGLILKSRVIYKDASDNVIAKKTVDFTNNPFMPEFVLSNTKTGHKEETRFIQSEYEVIFSKSLAEPEEIARLDIPNEGISDAGFDNFIIKHWDDLIAGEKYKREFLIPSMTDFIKFRIYQDKVVDSDGQSLRVINIEPDSFFIRAFAGTTKLYYDNDKPKLRKFDGVSNMRDSKGDNYNVMIRYEELNKLAAN